MSTLFDGEVRVHYGQLYVISDDLLDMTAAFAGQSNGLCGAGVPGGLFLMTATHTGQVRFTVELRDAEPPPADAVWEEVVEAPFGPASPRVSLSQWAGEQWWPLDLRQTEETARTGYRVRYCASGMTQAREDIDDLAPDRYLLQIWPAGDRAGQPDAVLRQTTPHAAYWHSYARALPPPPTPEQRAAAGRRAEEERQAQLAARRQREDALRWGGRPPSERLRRVAGNVFGIARLDRQLVDAVAETDPQTQRQIARWAARHAYAYAGIADLEWMVPAWEALDRGVPLPEEFTDVMAMWRRIEGTEIVVTSRVTMVAAPAAAPDPTNLIAADVAPVPMALPALMAAAQPDPLQAALEALWAAATAYGRDAPSFLAEVRRTFPLRGA